MGLVAKIGRYNYNLSAELLWTPINHGPGPTPERGVKFGVVLLLPE
jgi:hypothetical protein